MKFSFKHLKYLLVLPLLFLACAKDSNKNQPHYQQPVSYYMQNGQCYSNTGQIVNMQLCQTYGQGGTGYYMMNGQCYSQTGQIVNMQLCQTYGNGGTYGQSIQCNGVYYYYNMYSWQAVYCNGTNCSGYTVYNQQGQPVRCI